MELRVFRRKKRKNRAAIAVLCGCEYHLQCPVGGYPKVPDEERLATCTCPGSGLVREIELQLKQEVEQPDPRDAEVFQDLDVGRGRSAGEIQQQILTAYAAHGYEPPSDYSRMSRFIAAGTGRRGTRTIRLLVEAAWGLRAAWNWTPTAPDEADGATHLFEQQQEESEEGAESRSGRAVRRLFLVPAVGAILTAGAAVGAFFASGIVQVILIGLAVLLSALAAWVGLWVAVASFLVRVSSRSSPGVGIRE